MSPDLAAGQAWLAEHIAPQAQALDGDTTALGRALAAAAGQGLLGLKVPRSAGGAGWSGPDFLEWQQACARASGVFAFLQAQHQSACAVAGDSPNPAVHDRWLPRLAAGAITSGIAFSHLRRPGTPLTARRVPGGWRLDGQAPWVTGAGLFTHCSTAAVAQPDGGTLFVLHPLVAGAGLTLGPVLDLAAFTPAGTVTLDFDDHRVANDQVLALAPADWVAAKDRLSVAAQGMFALGCARAALDVVGDHPPGPALTAGLDAVRTELLARVDDGEHYAQALSARGRAIAWMGRCAHAAVTASAGSANLAHHPAQRIWRECLVFTVLSQSPDVRAATLAALAR